MNLLVKDIRKGDRFAEIGWAGEYRYTATTDPVHVGWTEGRKTYTLTALRDHDGKEIRFFQTEGYEYLSDDLYPLVPTPHGGEVLGVAQPEKAPHLLEKAADIPAPAPQEQPETGSINWYIVGVALVEKNEGLLRLALSKARGEGTR